MLQRKRILIVEDNASILITLKLAFELEGFEVLTAEDGFLGLDKVKQDPSPDLVVLDVMLPKLDGYKICKMLKMDNNYKQIPIIILTARSSQEDAKLVEDTGADLFLNKPCEFPVLLQEVKNLLKI